MENKRNGFMQNGKNDLNEKHTMKIIVNVLKPEHFYSNEIYFIFCLEIMSRNKNHKENSLHNVKQKKTEFCMMSCGLKKKLVDIKRSTI